MAIDKSKSLVMAQRLKQLRNEKGLSHESLRKALMEKYEIDISIDSLKNYEVSNTNHVKAYKNDGMRVEYLRYLADFYNVSADYIIGLSPVRTSDRTVVDIISKTHLTEPAAKLLCSLANATDNNPDFSMLQSLFPTMHVSCSDKLRLQIKAAVYTSLVSLLIESLIENPSIFDNYESISLRSILCTMHERGEISSDEIENLSYLTSEEVALFNVYEITRKLHIQLLAHTNDQTEILKY